MSLRITPINLDEANAFVSVHHRHHKPVPGAKFCIAVSGPMPICSNCRGTGMDMEFGVPGICYDCKGEKERLMIHGVAIVGRPVARMSDNGFTLEVNRLCTDGTKNAVSKLKGAICRVGFGLGYLRIITYTLLSEGGGSMRAAGWRLVGERGGGNWNVPSRPRIDTAHELRGQKLLWELTP